MLNIEKLKKELRNEGIESELITVVKNNVECMHIAKLNGRVCGAKRPHSVSKRSVNAMFG